MWSQCESKCIAYVPSGQSESCSELVSYGVSYGVTFDVPNLRRKQPNAFAEQRSVDVIDRSESKRRA